MRIDGVKDRRRNIQRRTTSSKAAIRQREFRDVFHEKTTEIDLDIALQDVDELANKLRQSPTYINLMNYKRAVKSCLKILLSSSYHVTENSFYDRIGRRRVFTLVKVIDEKLEELSKGFLERESRNIDLATRLDEIRGMLLDLYS
ncbi:MAG: YaaR family protein [Firmicutes bacterium]|nr:YaaR family protein [Bacillota bacterium]